MINLIDLEKKINSELTTKIKKSEIRHEQLYLNIESKDFVMCTLSTLKIDVQYHSSQNNNIN